MLDKDDEKPIYDRRTLLFSGVAAAIAGPIGAQALPSTFLAPAFDPASLPICRVSSDAAPVLSGAPRKLSFSWNAGAVCLATLPVAIDHGFFRKQNLDVDLVNYSGSTNQLLEAIATGKSDAGVGMALRWLKPLEQGFDVKITAGTHGGCLRVLTRVGSGIDSLADLKGKVVAVSDFAGPEKNFFSIQLAKQGIAPDTEVDWRAYPGNFLRLAVEKGEVQAFLASDPNAYLWLKDRAFKEVASNLDGEYRDKTCCIVGLRGSLVRNEPLVARALTQALLDAAMFTAEHPEEAAKAHQPYAPKSANEDDLRAMVRHHTHHHHPVGDVLKQELKLYADDLKLVSVFKPGTNTTKFADRIYANVFGA